MFVEDIKNDFYNLLLGNRVLLLVHYDVDAICTCKILQTLFKCDNIPYTLVPVGGIAELKKAYEENSEEVKFVVLVNCGGTIDIVDILQPEEDVVFFVLDSHKPSDVCNVYSDGQVRLVWKDSEENVPNFDDIFRDDDEESEAEDAGGEEGREARAAAVLRRRERRTWEEQRNTLMFNYTQFSYCGKPSACVALELAWRVSRCGVSVLWCAAVACASHAALHARPPAQCLLDADGLHRHVARLQNSTDAPDSASVSLEKDAWLPLYRSWSLEGAVRHAPTVAPHMQLHTIKGEARIRQLLADMGIPLQQARQAYRSMDVELRNSVLSALEAAHQKHNLPPPTRAAFLLYRAFSPARAAHDLVYVITALLEDTSTPTSESFQLALSSLSTSSGSCAALTRGTALARSALEAVARLVHSTLAARQLFRAGPFNYFIVQEGTPEATWVRRPLWLGVAARWAAAAAGPSRPLLASAPASAPSLTTTSATPAPDMCLLLGVPPRCTDEPRNLFGKAFEQAALQCGCTVSLDYLDSSVVALPTSQRAQFLDALTALLS